MFLPGSGTADAPRRLHMFGKKGEERDAISTSAQYYSM